MNEPIAFVLNGTPQTVQVAADETLLETLRDRFGLISVKDGCSPQGQCGACLVRVDGRPLTSCTLRTAAVAGKRVLTNEGLGHDDRLVLGRCFSAVGAVQCGFCIPGMVARAALLLERDPRPSREAIRRQLGPHLCRCTGYVKIVEAIELAAAVKRGEAQLPAARADAVALTGARLPRYRGEGYALGDEPYVADLSAPDMVHGALRLSDHPRALVRSIDVRRARQLPGVLAVATWRDVRGTRHNGLIEQDWPSFVGEGEVTCMIGDVIAAVAAVDRKTARAAAALVEVDYQVLVPVTDPIAALAPDAERVHPERRNLLSTTRYARGDADEALARSAHVVRETFRTQTIEHLYLEPEACLAVPRGPRGAETSALEIFSQGQGVYDDRRQLSRALDLPEEGLRVTLVPNGGAFGGKEDLSVQVQTGLLCQLTGRAVKLVLSREESIRLHPKRHPFIMEYTVGCDAEGQLTGLRARLVADTGAYASVGAKVVERAAGHACGPYHLPHVAVEGYAVYSNNPPNGAMRGFGVSQVAFAVEQLIDMLGERCGLDPYAMRHRNLLRDGQRFGPGQRMTHCAGLLRSLEAVEAAYRGAACAGLACGIKNVGIGNGMIDVGRARIDVLEGGRLRVAHGMTEMGQGLHGVALGLVSEVCGHALGDDTVVEVTTDDGLDCGMTTASRATVLVGNAILDAAAKLKADLDRDGELVALAGRRYLGEWLCDWTVKPGAPVDEPVTHLSFGYAAQVVVLDEATGKIRKVVAAHDVGRALNRAACEGQIEGSIHMGLGYALSEELQLVGGRPVHTQLRKLGVLRARQTPAIEVLLIEEPDPKGPRGARGVGEIGLVPTAPAVAAALHRFDGRRRTHLPMRDNYER